jgi:uncharacterized protein (TIGR01244 family)
LSHLRGAVAVVTTHSERRFMVQFIQIDEQTAVAGQLQPADFARVASSGFRLIINNRPDGEIWGQPKTKDLAAAAAQQGLGYVDLPFQSPVTVQPVQIAEFARLLGEIDSGVLAFCRSGARSTFIWAAAKVLLGAPSTEVLNNAARAGYDMREAASFVEELADAARAQ